MEDERDISERIADDSDEQTPEETIEDRSAAAASREAFREIRTAEPAGEVIDFEEQKRRIQDRQEAEALREKLGIEGGRAEVEFDPKEEDALDQMAGEIMSDSGEEGESAENLEENSKNFASRVIDFLTSDKLKESLENNPEALKWIGEFEKIRPEFEEFLQANLEKIKDTVDPRKIEEVYDTLKDRLPAEYTRIIDRELKSGQIDWKKVKGFLYQAVDFAPYIGGVKMSYEALRGMTLDGRKLQGWRRAMHAVEGVAFTALDFTGVGGVAARGAKGSVIGARVFRRSAAVARKFGADRKIYSTMWKTGGAIEKNPLLRFAIDKTYNKFTKQKLKKFQEAA